MTICGEYQIITLCAEVWQHLQRSVQTNAYLTAVDGFNSCLNKWAENNKFNYLSLNTT
jgi:hypothetical protein